MEKTVRTQVLLPQRLVADLKQIAKKEKTTRATLFGAPRRATFREQNGLCPPYPRYTSAGAPLS